MVLCYVYLMNSSPVIGVFVIHHESWYVYDGLSRIILYTEYEGLKMSVNLCITLLFSRQIAIGNAGPGSALDSIRAKQTFRCQVLNIGLMYKQ